VFALRASTFLGIAILVWMAWIVLASNQEVRIERTCQPTIWMGNVVTSAVQLIAPAHQDRIEGWFDNLDYGCRFIVWRLVYERAWLEAQEADSTAPQNDDDRGIQW